MKLYTQRTGIGPLLTAALLPACTLAALASLAGCGLADTAASGAAGAAGAAQQAAQAKKTEDAVKQQVDAAVKQNVEQQEQAADRQSQ